MHMTAYIANFLIKGYANVGDIGRAREIFESLVDPPFGVAAPNNHAPHNVVESAEINIMEPVYREVCCLQSCFYLRSDLYSDSFSFRSPRLGKRWCERNLVEEIEMLQWTSSNDLKLGQWSH